MPEISAAKLSLDPARLPAGPRVRVLDVGCGDGRHLVAAAARGCRTVGIDYDQATLRDSRARLPHGVDLIVADATRLPFHDATFDAVICTETLEHLRDDRPGMREIARVLADRGALHAAVPSHFTELAYFALSRGYREAPGGHVRIYRPGELVRRLADAGLRVDAFRYVHFVDSVVWLRFALTDFLRPGPRPGSAYEAAIAVAVALARPVPAWRRRLRTAISRSRLVAALDAAGALIWPKSFTLTATKRRPARNPQRRAGKPVSSASSP